MNVIYERCCGMDVHKDKIVACILTGRKKEIKSYSSSTFICICLKQFRFFSHRKNTDHL